MSAQDETLDRYHIIMRLNAQAHVLRIARQTGIFQLLIQGQRTALQIADQLDLDQRFLTPLLDSLVAMKVVEQYQEDYAIAAVTRLLCDYDNDLGDQQWQILADRLRGAPPPNDTPYLNSITATQWIHTGAAKQAAEILDIGGQRTGLRVLDWGCGSAVWSAAMAYADPLMRVTAIDTPERLVAARRTVQSIEMTDRYTFIELPEEAGLQAAPSDITAGPFDLILVAGRLTSHSETHDATFFDQLHPLLSTGGELAVIDLFKSPGASSINETIEALRILASTRSGGIRDASLMRETLSRCGFENCQFAFLAASRQGWGIMLAKQSPS